MLSNYITTFLRILLRQKSYSAINIFGLAIGISATLLISLYIVDELSYDKFHADADRIYRNNMFARLNGVETDYAEGAGAAADIYNKDVAGIESTVRLKVMPVTSLGVGEKAINLEKLIYADSNFFHFFSFKLLVGNPAQVLRGPNKIVLTESSALSLFGARNLDDYSKIIGRSILLGIDKLNVEVAGVAANAPSNSHFHFNGIVSLETDNQHIRNPNYFTVADSRYTYVKISPQASVAQITASLPPIVTKYFNAEFKGVFTMDEFKTKGNEAYFHLQPITEIHLGDPKTGEIESNGSRLYLYLLGTIGGFILCLACINFMNLTTARAASRAKEVGIRKTIGAAKKKLIGQFLLESFAYALLALFLALAIISISLSPFNFLANKALSIEQLGSPFFIFGIATLVLLVSLLAGSYPSFYLSSFRPAQVLKGQLGVASSGIGIRNSLVVFQFIISTGLIISSILFYKQIDYLQSLNPGYDRENVMCLRNTLSLQENRQAFKEELKRNSAIVDASFSSVQLSEIVPGRGVRRLTGAQEWHTFKGFRADEDFLTTMRFTLLKGRFFSKNFPSDSDAVVINETAANILGLSNLDRNEKLEFIDGSSGVKAQPIIGIIKDFNYESMKYEVGPLVMTMGGVSRLSVRFKPGDIHNNLELVQNIWKKYSSAPFEYSFLNKNLEAQYKSEEQLKKISLAFTGISILIACLGLLGLVTYVASQRTKEIGIRKVMGASVLQVVILLSKDFVKLVFIAFVIAIPIAWYGMNQWLATFAYRINFDFLIALGAGATVLIIALLTVSFESIKSAMGNPVESLRSE